VSPVAGYVVAVASTISAAGIVACVSYLRGISKRFVAIERAQFRDELTLLAHDELLKTLDPPRPSTRPRHAL